MGEIGQKFKCFYMECKSVKCDGKWVIRYKTKKYTYLKKISGDKNFTLFYEVGDIIKYNRKTRKRLAKEWGDGSYTIFPMKRGFPLYFEPIK